MCICGTQSNLCCLVVEAACRSQKATLKLNSCEYHMVSEVGNFSCFILFIKKLIA